MKYSKHNEKIDILSMLCWNKTKYIILYVMIYIKLFIYNYNLINKYIYLFVIGEIIKKLNNIHHKMLL